MRQVGLYWVIALATAFAGCGGGVKSGPGTGGSGGAPGGRGGGGSGGGASGGVKGTPDGGVVACNGSVTSAGRCLVRLATGQGFPGAVAIEGTNVYWVNDTGGEIMTVPVDGGTPVALATGENVSEALAVDGTNAYWSEPTLSFLRSVPLSGGTASTLAPTGDEALGLTLGAGYVYWVTLTGNVGRVPVGGGLPETIATGRPASTSYPAGIAVDNDSVYWGGVTATTDGSGGLTKLGVLLKMPRDGGSIATLASDPSTTMGGVVVNATNVYWSTHDSIMTAALNGTGHTVVASGLGGAVQIAIDDTNVYWADGFNGQVAAAPLSGGATTVLASGEFSALGVAVDALSVYWTVGNGSGTVSKVTPK